MKVAEAIATRRSVRAFLPEPIPAETLTRIFGEAQRAPSWCNIQPWRVWIATGTKRDELVTELKNAAMTQLPTPDLAFPLDYPEPYNTHRRQCGKALYEAMGVARDDSEGRRGAWMRNYEAFDAPVIAIVTMDKRFGLYGALDLGCWLQSVMLLAVEEGLATCAQAAMAAFPGVHRRVLGVGEDVNVVCGIALGREDPTAAANACRTSRDPLERNVFFVV